jgi:hypothetical protein
MRELMNGLPIALADSIIPRPKPSSNSLTQKLPGLLSRHRDVDFGAEQDIIPVPRAVAQAIALLIGTVAKEQGRNRSNAAALITDGQDHKHPAVKQWMAAYDFFVGWAHLDRNHEGGREVPSDAVVLAQIKVVEDVIAVRTAVFFENVKSVEVLLDQINAPIEEGA